MLEWLRSPIVYLEQFSTAEKLRELSKQFFNPRSCMYHYLSMAKGNFNEFLRDREVVKIKKYFYVLRPVLGCDWIKRKGTFPPMEFQYLVDGLVEDDQLREEIEKLLARKMAGEELRDEPRIDVLNRFLAEKISNYSAVVGDFDVNEKPSTEILDKLFRSTLNEVWN